MSEPVKMTLDEVIMFGYFYEKMIPMCEEFAKAKYRGLYGDKSPMILIESVTSEHVIFNALFDKNISTNEILKLNYFGDVELRANLLSMIDGMAYNIATGGKKDPKDTFANDTKSSKLFL